MGGRKRWERVMAKFNLRLSSHLEGRPAVRASPLSPAAAAAAAASSSKHQPSRRLGRRVESGSKWQLGHLPSRNSGTGCTNRNRMLEIRQCVVKGTCCCYTASVTVPYSVRSMKLLERARGREGEREREREQHPALPPPPPIGHTVSCSGVMEEGKATG
jgi:hypothetical protein